MSCEEFQFLAGALPRQTNWSQRLHWIMCRACARYLKEMRALDQRIERALALSHYPP